MKNITLKEIQVIYRPKFEIAERPKISSSHSAFQLLKQYYNPNTLQYRETVTCIYLNRANKVLGISTIGEGGFSGAVADPKMIFGIGLKSAASSIILAHNHPSGELKPSQADINLTNKLHEAGKLLQMPLLDHLIISIDKHYSFADEGILGA